jgi:hypothetical protein
MNNLESISKTVNERLQALPQTIQTQVTNAQSSVSNTMNDFSSKTAVSGPQEFLESNSMIAKFVFLLFVLIAFMVLLNLGVFILGFIVSPSTNPYIIKGSMKGTNGVVVAQDPKNKDAATILRSNDQTTGLEYTWSTWIYIEDVDSTTTSTYQNVFNKGNGVYDASGIATVNNSPGMYIQTDVSDTKKSTNTIRIVTDTVNSSRQTVDISGIPFKKWVHVAIRMENNVMDVYVNGTISSRTRLLAVAKQNYNDVQVCQNGGFNGEISNLRYYNKALSAYEINNIIWYGPNLTVSTLSPTSSSNTGFSYYLSNLWYRSKL